MIYSGAVSSDHCSIERIYRAIRDEVGESASRARSLVTVRHWFDELADFDRRTGEAIPESMTSVLFSLWKLRIHPPRICTKDRVHRIIEHSRRPIEELLRQLIERLVREQAMLPVRAVRELDTGSFAALSRRPGRTIREKLADKPYMQAIRRRGTNDTTENRLLKALVRRLADLLTMRTECFRENETVENSELLQILQSWLMTEEAREIGRWNNHPPNNALLQHRNYRRVWDAWLWSQSLDQDIQRDLIQYRRHSAVILFWSLVSTLDARHGVRFVEQPCYYDYEGFIIRPGLTKPETLATADGLWFSPSQIKEGVVDLISPKEFGFAVTGDGKRVFFHAKDFLNQRDFKNLKKGTVIWFLLAKNDKGWNARDVVIENEPRPVRVDLASDLRIRLCFGNYSVNMDVCPDDGSGIKVISGKQTFSSRITPKELIELADRLVSRLSPREVQHAAEMRQAVTRQSRSSRHSVVDFCTLRPRFADEHGRGIVPFRLLWQLWQQPDQSPVEIALPFCDAIALHPDAKTVSILNLIGQSGAELPNSALHSQAAKSFAAQIKEFHGTDSLTYLVPDSADDFSLEIIRKSLNFEFANAEPLPRSVATVFDWQSSRAFSQSKIRDGDCVWVIDPLGSCLCITPLIAVHSIKLEQCVPETRGISWERCPSIHGETVLSTIEEAIKALNECHCPYPEDIGRLCGLQGILDGRDTVSWYGPDGNWFTPPSDIYETWCTTQNPTFDCWNPLERELHQNLRELTKGADIHLLLAGDNRLRDHVKAPPPSITGSHRVQWSTHRNEPTLGGMVFNQWQVTAADTPLWCDRLPELSIRIVRDGHYELFPLVKKATVNPKRGKTVIIPIEEQFILPAGQDFYQFPLLQGSEGNELQYEASLKSPLFPLKHDIHCRLVMTFTYGADDPYALTFIPIDASAAGFSNVQARWQPKSEITMIDDFYPAFPITPQWQEYRNYLTISGKTLDLYKAIANTLDYLDNTIRFMKTACSGKTHFDGTRRIGHIARIEDREDRDGRPVVRGSIDVEGCNLMFNSYDFEELSDVKKIKLSDLVSFNVVEANGRHKAKRITLGISIPRSVGNRIRDQLALYLMRIYNGAFSDIESEMPHEVISSLKRSVSLCSDVVSNANGWSQAFRNGVTSTMAGEALLCLCCLHYNAPDFVYAKLNEAMDSTSPRDRDFFAIRRHLGIVLGDLRRLEQQVLLDGLVRRLKQGSVSTTLACIDIFSIAIWRCEGFVLKLRVDHLTTVAKALEQMLRNDARYISSSMSQENKETLRCHLELLLGLIRTRASKDDLIKRLLSPNHPTAKRFAQIVDLLIEKVGRAEITLRTRVKLLIQKPDGLHNTPDILYALRLYLTGDVGSRAIQVTGIDDDE